MAELVMGKPIRITLAAWLAVRTGIAIKSVAITWRHIGKLAQSQGADMRVQGAAVCASAHVVGNGQWD